MMLRRAVGLILLIAVQLWPHQIEASARSWTSDPIIDSERCDNLEYQDVVDFLQKYFYPTLSYSGGQREAGQKMMSTYAIASALILRSQICLAEALALKRLVQDLKKQTALLTSGTSMSKRQLRKQRQLTAEANEEITVAADRTEELSSEQRKSFAIGSSAYLAGTYATARLFKAIEKYLAETADDMTEVSKPRSRFGLPSVNDVRKVVGSIGTVNTVRVLFAGLQDHMRSLYDTSRFLAEYSKRQKLDLPADATDQLSVVSDWV